MSEIALYNVLTKLGAASDEAEKAVADVASSKEVATKSDLAELETRLIEKMSDLEGRLTKLIYAIVAINTGVIIAAIGLMIRFL